MAHTPHRWLKSGKRRRWINCCSSAIFAIAVNAAPLYPADEKTIELAKKEGRVSFYTSMGSGRSGRKERKKDFRIVGAGLKPALVLALVL